MKISYNGHGPSGIGAPGSCPQQSLKLTQVRPQQSPSQSNYGIALLRAGAGCMLRTARGRCMAGLILLFLLFSALPLYATDMRQAATMARQELEQARKREQARRTHMNQDKTALTQEISQLESEITQLENALKAAEERIDALQKSNAVLVEATSNNASAMDELAGAVRIAGDNLKALLTGSMFTAWHPHRLERLDPLLNDKRFPGIDDMKVVSDLFLEESSLSGDIELKTGTFISDTGREDTGEILILGGFTAAYRSRDTTGFLNYSQESGKLYALSALPPRHIRKNLNQYMDGRSDAVYIDISRGGALRQIAHRQSLSDQIKSGGLLVWPILALGVLALIITFERLLFLGKVHANADQVMGKVNDLAAQGQWEACDDIVGNEKKAPVFNVLRSGLAARTLGRETLESILQESILKELPRLERFLPMLNIMGAIAPLLGLLGTVTGMIGTFHVITLYGTGDPRMMSGGISTALVTTMLGLSVAIPIMLLYTFLCRRVEHVIGDMEEKAVALSNIIYREAG